MAEFVIEIVGTGRAIRLAPVGTIDLPGARSLIDALDAARVTWNATLVSIDVAKVTGLTDDAAELLRDRAVPVAAALSAAA
jgi:hypothetical protein